MTAEQQKARMALMRRPAPTLPPSRAGQRYAPARKIVRRSHKGPVGNIRSYRHGRVDYEGHLERDFLLRAVVDPDIFDLRHQPMKLHWNDEGVRRAHYPDFSLRRRDQPVIVEVKTLANSRDPLIRRRTRELERRFAREGVTYELVTDAWIRKEPDLSNAKLLCLSLAYEPTKQFVDDVYDLLDGHPGGLAVQAIPDQLSLPDDAIYLVYAMVRNGFARFTDPDVLVGPHSLIVGTDRP